MDAKVIKLPHQLCTQRRTAADNLIEIAAEVFQNRGKELPARVNPDFTDQVAVPHAVFQMRLHMRFPRLIPDLPHNGFQKHGNHDGEFRLKAADVLKHAL